MYPMNHLSHRTLSMEPINKPSQYILSTHPFIHPGNLTLTPPPPLLTSLPPPLPSQPPSKLTPLYQPDDCESMTIRLVPADLLPLPHLTPSSPLNSSLSTHPLSPHHPSLIPYQSDDCESMTIRLVPADLSLALSTSPNNEALDEYGSPKGTTHPLNMPYQHTRSTHPLNTPSTHPLNKPSCS